MYKSVMSELSPMQKFSWLRLGQLVTGRMARNVLFWLLFTLYHYSGQQRIPVYYLVLFVTLFVSYGIPCYVHNFYLIPLFLQKRKPFGYLLLFLPLLGITICCSYYITHAVNAWFEGLNYMGNLKDVAMGYHFFPSLLMFVMFAAGKFTHDAFDSQRKLDALITEKLNSELSGLRSQLNPHFLFNALNTVYGLSRQNHRLSSNAILMLSDVLRYVLYDGNANETELGAEVSFLQDYINFQNLRQRESQRIRLDTNISNPQLRIAPLLFLPFVENAIKHGQGQSITDAMITVNLYQNENQIRFCCTNLYGTRPAQPGGIGLQNATRRLQLLYPGQHSLQITDSGTEFEVTLNIETR